MPKLVQYSKGSIIYFEEDKDDRIFILQRGTIVLTSTDIETKKTVSEVVGNGEFFGAKSALGHFPREETANTITDATVVSMTTSEFEQLFSTNKGIIMKMLRVFSKQLRQLHKKTESILNSAQVPDANGQNGMVAVAKSFYNEEQYRSCMDAAEKYLRLTSDTDSKSRLTKLYNDSKLRFEKLRRLRREPEYADDERPSDFDAQGTFTLPGFERFAKTYEPGQVIIAEYEPGNSFYFIQSGTVQLTKCVNGIKKNIDILKPGEFFGEMAILDNSPRSATCIARSRVEALEFNKANFEVLVTGNPQIALILLKLFCKRIYDQKRRLRVLAQPDAQSRIADMFLMLDEMSHNDLIVGPREFNITRNDVAHWTGLPLDVTYEELDNMHSKFNMEIYENRISVDVVDMRRIVDTKAMIRRMQD